MDETKSRVLADQIAAAERQVDGGKVATGAADPSAAGNPPYAAAANGILTAEGLQQACGHVWRDSNSTMMLGADVLNSEPVSYDDKRALLALRRHIAAAGPRAFLEDVLPNLRFGPVRH